MFDTLALVSFPPDTVSVTAYSVRGAVSVPL
jgi:hypothetical protein